MKNVFHGPLAAEMQAFLQFKQSLGYGYVRPEFTLREFDRFLVEYAAGNRQFGNSIAPRLPWLSSKPGRKPISVSADAAVLRQFHRYLRRSSKPGTIAEPSWPHLPTESSFVPYSLSEKDVSPPPLTLCADLKRPPFRAALYRALILVLYCFYRNPILKGPYACECETLDTRSAVLFVDTFRDGPDGSRSIVRYPGRLDRYLGARLAYCRDLTGTHVCSLA